MRGDVAAAARIGVEPPGAADGVAALEHHEVLDPGLAQLDGHAQAGEAGADDGDVDLGRERIGVSGRRDRFEEAHGDLHNRNLRLCNIGVTMATRAPARMSAEARREQLLDVTKAIVARHGFHAVSIERVAREAGISRPIVYGHFDDLPGLLDALVRREGARALGQLAERAAARRSRAASPASACVAALDGYLQASRPTPETWRLVLVPSEGAPARAARGDRARPRAPWWRSSTAALGGGERGLDAPDPELAAHLLSALADEAARLMLADPQRYPRERVLALARWFLGVVPPV